MDALQLWAMVSFTARGGNTEGLLNAAASGGLHLSRLTAQPDGFAGQCAAWRYRRLASMARRRRVRLRIPKNGWGCSSACALCSGAPAFGWGPPSLCPFCSGAAAWFGLWITAPLSTGQQARAAIVLRTGAGLEPGAYVTQERLAAGEYALLQSGEFSWAST